MSAALIDPVRGHAQQHADGDQHHGRDLQQGRPALFPQEAVEQAKRVSNRIICPIMVSGSRRLALFQQALPNSDAKIATPADTATKCIHSLPGCGCSITVKAGTAMNSDSSPVTTPISRFQSCAETSCRRASQRLLPTA